VSGAVQGRVAAYPIALTFPVPVSRRWSRPRCGRSGTAGVERSSSFQLAFVLNVAAITDNTANSDGADAGSGSALLASGSRDEQAGLPQELTELDDFPDVLTGIDYDSGGNGVPGSGAVSGGFGFAGLALAVVCVAANWTSGVVVSHGQYGAQMKAPGSGLTVQQELNTYAKDWHTQGWRALVFAAAAVLFGAGALLWPRVLRSGGAPGWARAAAAGAVMVGLAGALVAVLTIAGVSGGHLMAPASAS
jgi:hypothetical protein